jgi:hypothetical protein
LTSAAFIIGIIIYCGFVLFLLDKIHERKNWARIVFLVMFISDFHINILYILFYIMNQKLTGIYFINHTILQIATIAFLFSRSSNKWFSNKKLK